MNTQQTPNPEAQFPSAFPALLVHSVLEKHVPRTVWEEDVDAPVHWLKNVCIMYCKIMLDNRYELYLLGNVTTLKSDRSFCFLWKSFSGSA